MKLNECGNAMTRLFAWCSYAKFDMFWLLNSLGVLAACTKLFANMLAFVSIKS